MPTTRRQSAIAEGKIKPEEDSLKKAKKRRSTSSGNKGHAPKPKSMMKAEKDGAEGPNEEIGDKRPTESARNDLDRREEPPPKKVKTGHESTGEDRKDGIYKSGTIECGHIYFFYRPRVEHEEIHDIDDVKNFHILLIPRPPRFAQGTSSEDDGTKADPGQTEESEMSVLEPGADAVPAPAQQAKEQHYRLITVGKKKLPDPEHPKGDSGRQKENFWATVTAVGDNLELLTKGLEGKEYETKTRGTRHQGPARLVARGAYAIVNNEALTPSKRETHLGYHVSHPSPAELSDVQTSLGIYSASSFIVQVKNPKAPAMTPQQAHSKGAEYPDWILRDVFGSADYGAEHSRGREKYGLRFASLETPELLDYRGAELLLIAAREGEQGLETSLGGGRGTALQKVEEEEGHEGIKQVFDELGLDLDKFPIESLEGSWI